jgi:hypothetical protein
MLALKNFFTPRKRYEMSKYVIMSKIADRAMIPSKEDQIKIQKALVNYRNSETIFYVGCVAALPLCFVSTLPMYSIFAIPPIYRLVTTHNYFNLLSTLKEHSKKYDLEKKIQDLEITEKEAKILEIVKRMEERHGRFSKYYDREDPKE